ncbi:hypothetical protein ACQ4LE_002239 [Meloidogyne hapla]
MTKEINEKIKNKKENILEIIEENNIFNELINLNNETKNNKNFNNLLNKLNIIIEDFIGELKERGGNKVYNEEKVLNKIFIFLQFRAFLELIKSMFNFNYLNIKYEDIVIIMNLIENLEEFNKITEKYYSIKLNNKNEKEGNIKEKIKNKINEFIKNYIFEKLKIKVRHLGNN